ncbi:putative Alpha/Beta hydrolase protein [Seiridium unicorne]|uniref:Alpha/Beta hydrolase protein n=1 Tax=Seiridium unicorne TaxID=138068 RepID=A0ABR2VCC2_9PEZI
MITIGELYRPTWPPASYPTFVKQYEARSHLPIRVFLPQSYDMSSGGILPVLFTVHGGGFSIGSAADDDRWNRLMADTQGLMVIGLNHSKAPLAPYPTAIYDIEAVILAVMSDMTLPIDRTRTAIGGSFSGATLAFAVVQLPSIRQQVGFQAAVSSCGLLELGISTSAKADTRPYKPSLSSARSATTDSLTSALPSIQWSYTPAGTDMTDPLYAPFYAPASALPPHVCLMAAELDILAHDSWRMACRLASRRVPGMHERVGRSGAGAVGKLELSDERFVFEDTTTRPNGAKTSVKWLLVPDVIHGFDLKMPDALIGDDETREDAREKTRQLVASLGQWLRDTVWAS